MIDPSDKNRLLEDVLAEGEKADFRDALLAKILRGARRKRQRRTAGKLTVTMLALAFAWITFSTAPRFLSKSVRPEVAKVTSSQVESAGRIRVVETEAFNQRAVVHTFPLTAGQFATSRELVAKVASHATAKIVSTQNFPKAFSDIGDRQLLALISPHPAALIRDSRGMERLVFVNASEERGFPVN